jgi:hypothetical protein
MAGDEEKYAQFLSVKRGADFVHLKSQLAWAKEMGEFSL